MNKFVWRLFAGILGMLLAQNAVGTALSPAKNSLSSYTYIQKDEDPLAQYGGGQGVEQTPIEWELSLYEDDLPEAEKNAAYSFDFKSLLRAKVTSGPPLAFDLSKAQWSVTDGMLASGFSLDPQTGILSGTPTAKNLAGISAQIQVQLPDESLRSDQQWFTLYINGVLLRMTSLDIGVVTACAVTQDGAAKCWGKNEYGQIGDGTFTQQTLPTQVTGLTSGVSKVAMGYAFACAILTSGKVQCWGRNQSSQLGDGATANRSTPYEITSLSNVVSISAGSAHACAITAAGALQCWGAGGSGQIGNGTLINATVPASPDGLGSGVSQVSVGDSHSCALTTSGGVKCWGYNARGAVGDGSNSSRSRPVDVTGLTSGVKQISSGYLHACAVTMSGAAKCWGNNEFGQLGNGSTTHSSVPVDVDGLSEGVAQVAAGWDHSCARMTSGQVKCWGRNLNGNLGDDTTADRLTPVDVLRLNDATHIVARYNFTCAQRSDNTGRCWGWNINGQLGDGTTSQRYVPTGVLAEN